ncbi:MAG: DUF3127 domain-containing protein [Bacteroidetes bacterium]|nr:DUF3127 domain-containing protein [Bacteroidota bacterium]
MSELTIRGVVIEVMQPESGVSAAGKEWKKQEFLIETEGQYPKNIAFTLFGDRTDLLMKVWAGLTVDVSFNLESKKYNGRWFHSANAWKIIVQQNERNTPPPPPPEPPQAGADDGLPF